MRMTPLSGRLSAKHRADWCMIRERLGPLDGSTDVVPVTGGVGVDRYRSRPEIRR